MAIVNMHLQRIQSFSLQSTQYKRSALQQKNQGMFEKLFSPVGDK